MLNIPNIIKKRDQDDNINTILYNSLNIAEEFGISLMELSGIIQDHLGCSYNITKRREHLTINAKITTDKLKILVCKYARNIKKSSLVIKIMKVNMRTSEIGTPTSSSGNNSPQMTVIEDIMEICHLFNTDFESFIEDFSEFTGHEMKIYKINPMLRLLGDYNETQISDSFKDMVSITAEQYIPKIEKEKCHCCDHMIMQFLNPMTICNILNIRLSELIKKFNNNNIDAVENHCDEILITHTDMSIEDFKMIIFS